MSTVFCVICLYVPPPDKKTRVAVTVINGYAVCDDHLGYVDHGEHWSSTLAAARREAKQA